MKHFVVLLSHHHHHHGQQSVNTNAEDIPRLQCERNKCENERQRLRDRLEQLIKYRKEKQRESWIDRWCPCCCRRSNRERRVDYEYKSSLYQSPISFPYIDQTQHEFQPSNNPPYKSLVFKNLETKILNCLSNTPRSESISVLSNKQSSLHSAFSPDTSTSHSGSVLNSGKSLLSVKNYEKSLLTVPNSDQTRTSKTSINML
ncbi:hypothetical protein I4U23_024198 [Adineta vaga]|nr:hypothetical protein I4U23_024198 [Adineta vaga]